MFDKAMDKLDQKIHETMDKHQGQTSDAPVDLPGTFKKRDPKTNEDAEADTGREDDIPVPRAKSPV